MRHEETQRRIAVRLGQRTDAKPLGLLRFDAANRRILARWSADYRGIAVQSDGKQGCGATAETVLPQLPKNCSFRRRSPRQASKSQTQAALAEIKSAKLQMPAGTREPRPHGHVIVKEA